MADELAQLSELVRELSDRIESQNRKIEQLYTVNVQFRDYMQWLRGECDKLVAAAGPVMSMVGPLLGQMMSGADAATIVGEIAGIEQQMQQIEMGVEHGS